LEELKYDYSENRDQRAKLIFLRSKFMLMVPINLWNHPIGLIFYYRNDSIWII